MVRSGFSRDSTPDIAAMKPLPQPSLEQLAMCRNGSIAAGGNAMPQFGKYRAKADNGLEVMVLTYWSSLDAVNQFAGEQPSKAYMSREIAETLQSWDEHSRHFEQVIADKIEL